MMLLEFLFKNNAAPWLMSLAICCSVMQTAAAQIEELQAAQEFMAAKNYVQASYLYSEILKGEPENKDARFQRAIISSWQKEYANASSDFQYLLDRHPGDASLLTAYAYNQAWSGNYVESESLFRKVLTQDPYHHESLKGLAYVALWKGKGKLAVNRFDRLLQSEHLTPDLHVGQGHALLLAGKHKAARHAFETAISLQENHKGSVDLLQAVQASPALLELSVWGGYTRFKEDQAWGLRLAEIAFQPNHFYRLWARYDNTLSLENFTLAQSEQRSEAYLIGGMVNWNRTLTTKVEVGYRGLPESNHEKLLILEQLVIFRNQWIIKGGAVLNQGIDNIWTTYGGITVPVMDGWSLEPVYFFTQPQGSNTREQRFQLNSYTQLGKGHQINLAGIWGRVSIPENTHDNIYGGSLSWNIPTARKHWTTLMVRYESGIQELLTASLGFKYRLER